MVVLRGVYDTYKSSGVLTLNFEGQLPDNFKEAGTGFGEKL